MKKQHVVVAPVMITNLLIGRRKGSVLVRVSQARADMQYEGFLASELNWMTEVLKDDLVAGR